MVGGVVNMKAAKNSRAAIAVIKDTIIIGIQLLACSSVLTPPASTIVIVESRDAADDRC
jgi:hypothetical protein